MISPRARRPGPRAARSIPRADRGTGPNGRIVERDVRAYLDGAATTRSDHARGQAARGRGGHRPPRRAGTGASGRIMVDDVARAVAEKPRPMTKMRQVIAQRLTRASPPRRTSTSRCQRDMTDLLVPRRTSRRAAHVLHGDRLHPGGRHPGLQEFPTVNSVTRRPHRALARQRATSAWRCGWRRAGRAGDPQRGRPAHGRTARAGRRPGGAGARRASCCRTR